MTAHEQEFITERDGLLQVKPDQDALELATDIVNLLGLVAIHGSSGMMGDPVKKALYIANLELRIKFANE